jgi:hypothetical protein
LHQLPPILLLWERIIPLHWTVFLSLEWNPAAEITRVKDCREGKLSWSAASSPSLIHSSIDRPSSLAGIET